MMTGSGNSYTRAQPQDFGQLFGWWNFNRSAITLASANNISAITDLSGNGNTFTATGSGNLSYPQFVSNGFNGRAAAQFSHTGTTGMTAGNVAPFNSAGFTYLMFNQTSADPTINQITFSKHTSAGTFYVGGNNASDGANTRHFMATADPTPTRVDIFGSAVEGSFSIIIARYDANAGKMTLMRNGVSIATGNLSGAPHNAGDPLMMGTYNGGGNFHLEGYIGEIVCFLGALTNNAINDFIAYYMRPYWGYNGT